MYCAVMNVHTVDLCIVDSATYGHIQVSYMLASAERVDRISLFQCFDYFDFCLQHLANFSFLNLQCHLAIQSNIHSITKLNLHNESHNGSHNGSQYCRSRVRATKGTKG